MKCHRCGEIFNKIVEEKQLIGYEEEEIYICYQCYCDGKYFEPVV